MSLLKRWLGLALLWLVLIAVLLEGGLRLAAPVLPQKLAVTARWVMTGQPYAEDWTPAWQQNRDHYYALRPSLQNELQYGSPGVSFHLSTVELWEGGGIGFRNRPVDYFVDAVVVGDSFGFCFTERADCWVNRLEDQTGMGLVNLSQPVTGSTSHKRILETFGQPLEPPLVIWQFFGNDFNDDYGLAVFRDEIDPIAEESETAGHSSLLSWLRKNVVGVAVLETVLTGRWYGLPQEQRRFEKPHRTTYGDHVLEFGGLYEQQALDMSREQNQIGFRLSRQAFREAKELVTGWGGTMVVVLIPTREEVYAHLTTETLGEETMAALTSARDAMFDLCDTLDLHCFDPLPALRDRALRNEPLYYRDDMHLNPHGNAVLADALARWLDAQGLMQR